MDSVTQETNIIFLTEAWIDNDERTDMPIKCIAQFKRDVRSASCAIYQNLDDNNNVLMNISVNIGDICACYYKTDNGFEIIMVVVYISQNKNYEEMELFFH